MRSMATSVGSTAVGITVTGRVGSDLGVADAQPRHAVDTPTTAATAATAPSLMPSPRFRRPRTHACILTREFGQAMAAFGLSHRYRKPFSFHPLCTQEKLATRPEARDAPRTFVVRGRYGGGMPGEKLADPIAETVAALGPTAAGPKLAAMLSLVADLPSLTGSQCVDVLKARHRQSNHERGQLLAVVAEVTRRTDADKTVFEDCPIEFGVDEVRAALVMTRRAAGDLCGLAEDLRSRLPQVQAALAAGTIDQPRARVFSLWTDNLTDKHARTVVARLLPKAARLTTGQLIREIS